MDQEVKELIQSNQELTRSLLEEARTSRVTLLGMMKLMEGQEKILERIEMRSHEQTLPFQPKPYRKVVMFERGTYNDMVFRSFKLSDKKELSPKEIQRMIKRNYRRKVANTHIINALSRLIDKKLISKKSYAKYKLRE